MLKRLRFDLVFLLLALFSSICQADIEIPLVIIGGGPAGLSLGYELTQLGHIPNLDFVILEKGEDVGETWKQVPQSTRLLTPWGMNYLMNDMGDHSYQDLVGQGDFAKYLQQMAEKYELSVQVKTEVISVSKTKTGHRFQVHTSNQDYQAERVVVATGYFSNPQTPKFHDFHKLNIPTLHWAKYLDSNHVKELTKNKERPRALVVGKGLSAGQVLYDLCESGFDLAVSVRGPIKFGLDTDSSSYAAILLSTYQVEKLVLSSWFSGFWPSIHPGMEGGKVKKLFDDGRVLVLPNIVKAINENTVLFENGKEVQFDIIIFATGFAPQLSFLDRLGSPQTPRLYFLGFDGQYNSVSRFLRGIRQDAKKLANHLEAESNSDSFQ